MNNEHAILITSIGTKVPLIKCIKATTHLKIIGYDIHENIVGQYFVDDFFVEERLANIDLQKFILKCHHKKIKYIIPTREEDLIFFSTHKEQFEKNHIFIMVSPLNAIQLVNDKQLFCDKLLKKGYPVIPSIQITELEEDKTYVLKEKLGAGSKNLFLNINKTQVMDNYKQLSAPIIQPYIEGKEYSIDVYVSNNQEAKCVVRERVLVIDGESQITKVVAHYQLEQLISHLAVDLNLRGHIMFQAFEDKSGNLWIIECNARIGGASTLSIYAGLDSFNWWINEIEGKNNEIISAPIQALTQIRYKEDKII